MNTNRLKPTRRTLPAPLFTGLVLFPLALLFLFASSGAGTGLEPKKNVLVLFSGPSHLPAYALINQGIKSTFSLTPGPHIEYYIEYLDVYRDSSPDHYLGLLELYRRKYSRVGLDLVIAIDSPALRFAEEHGDELFPLAPVVYPWALPKELEQINLGTNFTGVLAEVDFAGQLELILQVQPRTRRVVFVNGAASIDLVSVRKFHLPVFILFLCILWQ